MIKTYRRDIDTLRAISVIFVIFFHLKLPFFENGFLGVDIFFVISGFLITKIIIEDIEIERFHLKDFYLRRIRRIIPLVLCVTFISYIAAYFILFPDELEEFKKSFFFVNVFLSNFWYYLKGDYFSPITDNDPLIHFWSLSVEEQYYLIYPILFIFFFNQKKIRNFLLIIILIAFFSFMLTQLGGNLKFRYPYIENEFKFISIPGIAFFSTFTRAWEILLGCIAAIYTKNYLKKLKYQNYIVNISFYLLIASFFLLNSEFPHPSIITFIPIFFTLIILIYNNDNLSKNPFLNSKLLSSIGLISFSLYLWHQPVFVFSKIYNIIEISYFFKFLLLVFIFLISYISWKFIEKPFRNKNFIDNKKLIFFISSYLSIIFLSIVLLEDNKTRFKDDELSILEYKKYYEKKYFDDCTTIPKNYIEPKNACIIGNQKLDKVEFAIIGDSHASTLAESIDKKLKKINKSAYLFTINGCPISSELYNFKDNRFECIRYYKELKNFLSLNHSIKYLILHTRWGFYVSGKRFDNKEGGKEDGKNTIFINEEKDLILNEKNREELVIEKNINFIKNLPKNKKIIIITAVPEVGFNVPDTMTRALRFDKVKKLRNFTTSFNVYQERQNKLNKKFEELKENSNVYLLDTSKVFCNRKLNRCDYSKNNKPLYFDDDHLNRIGSSIMIDQLFNKKFFQNLM
jgi:peptidoglycan/LPS O-acetylase OafA/YrhL